MIEHIKNIGAYVLEKHPNESVINGMVNTIESKDMKYILLINVLEREIKYTTKDFEKDVVYDALFYQSGRGAEGGGVRLDFYVDISQEKIEERFKKGRDKLKKACEFCEIGNRYEEIKEQVEAYLQEKDKNTFAVIQVNGKMPRELFEDKFIKKMYSMVYKSLPGKHICHLCGEVGQGYNTTTYKFYTNDKGIYNNVEHKEKSGIIIGEGCLNDIIIGKKYLEENLSTYWSSVGEKVMFLPHHYDEEIANSYEKSYIKERNGEEQRITTIRLNEEELVEEVGKTKAVTDMIFYEDDSKFFYINHVLQSVLPSRFSYIGSLFNKYQIKLNTILMYSTAVKISSENIETTKKEKMRMIESIFTGRKIDRNLFFKRVTDVYKHYYLKEEHKKYACMRSINRAYNFLWACNCLEKGWDVMADYKDYIELFEKNKEYFDTNEKMAWFILGKAYSTMVYLMKNNRNKTDENTNENERTSLEKNFFFSRKFDYKDFVYFSNILTDKAIKYNVDKSYFKKMICEAKEYMAKKENKLSFDESKYLFFWGADSYFKIEKEEKQESEEE
ncbi:TIGR02556 family CRISPR-associated protein [Alkaliphilus peptidifermentans]|uniref:CRISPR-associated protein Csh1 n=1 Tax=Alkaliphilus peptidifermentans DSM 18978 TaxID=1120976 RepID=A0A1G5IU20_9FIRM|nr:TIGR02556 family CRISPR-associated protein [Alkaliphilus peptidifermentans]SCY79583.1 CRISPR-associated protein Csh1 [Alkaliphilus peptidifermentans DSM 18978]